MKKLTSISLCVLSFLVALIALFVTSSQGTVAAQSPAEFRGLPSPELCDTIGPAGTPYEFGVNCRYMAIEAFPRTYVVYVPDSVQPNAPVIFLFHGTNGDGDGYLQNSGWVPKAQAEGIVLVSASGLRYCPKTDLGLICPDDDPTVWETKWHSYQLADEYDLGQRMPGYPQGATWPPDDVGFIDLVMADVSAMGDGQFVDSDHFYATGFSAGAGFTARLARELPDQLAAVAYSSGGIVETSIYTGTPAVDIPVLALLGTNEPGILALTYADNPAHAAPLPLDPAEFLTLDNLLESYVVPQLDAFEHHYAGANLNPVEILEGDGHTLYRWRTGSTQHLFQMGVLQGLKHAVPNGCDTALNPLGWSAPDIYWEFFTSAPDYLFTILPTSFLLICCSGVAYCCL